MSRLTADRLRGIWAGITMCWDERYRFDEKTYAQNISRTINAKVHGIYTTGSTGEFYAMEHEEFCRMVDIQADLCGPANMPLQIGCCADATYKTIKMLEYANGKEAVGAVQVNLPYWMELSDRQLLQFFKDLYNACSDMPLIHYNIPRAKRFLNGQNYLKILDVAPSLIGVKYTYTGTHFGQLQQAMMVTPQLSYFVGEDFLASAMQLGARGCYSSLVATNPKYTLDYYQTALNGNWNKAIGMQQHIAKFFSDAETFVEQYGEDAIDPVFDKGLGIAAGCILGHQRCRAPYYGWKDETIVDLRKWLQSNYPEFIYQS